MRCLRILCGLLALVAAFTLGVLAGYGNVARPCEPSPASSAVVTDTVKPSESVCLDVPPLCQYPDFPTGCEVIAATMALRCVGVAAEVEELLPHLPTSRDWYWCGGQFYGPDPNTHFCGDPRSEDSYGCFAPVIWTMLTSYLGDDSRVVDATGLTLPQLCRLYIDCDSPVIVWATTDMAPVTQGRRWILPDGSAFTWPAGEHCLLLVGYDEENYYFNDPDTGKQVTYPREQAEQRYEELGRQALVVPI